MLGKWIMSALKEIKKIHIIENIRVKCNFDEKEENLIIMPVNEDSDFLKDKSLYTDYVHDIINTYFENEQKRIVVSGLNHQNIRNYLIDVIKCYAKRKKYSYSTIHLAALYLDIYMDAYILSSVTEHQKFVALVTLLLAAKTEENDDNVPSIKDLLYIVDLTEELGVDFKEKQKYTKEELSTAYKSYLKLYCTLEFMIFQTLKFNTIYSTAVSFLCIFQKIAVTESDVQDMYAGDLSIDSFADLKFYATEYIKSLTDLILYEITFHQFLPSKVAAAVIATTRKLLNIKTVWNLQLEFLTHASLMDIQPIMTLFLEKLKTMDRESSTSDDSFDYGDSGFYSNDCGFETNNSATTPEISDNELNDDVEHEHKKVRVDHEL
ncbi:cyclin-J-like [Chironomus tepperi]|uniref:cyclin-J-like n=1 Tax=Chironomus tepperi TaxID=113505 RepID=UPI00391F70C5